jgi:AraC family transcriptional activator FtrA
MHNVVALLVPPVSLFELACLVEVFGLPRDNVPDGWYSFTACTFDGDCIGLAASELTIGALGSQKALENADTIVVPSFPIDKTPSPTVIGALRSAAKRGARIVSICTGAFLLAEAGLLDKRRATTHWLYRSQFESRFPAVQFEPDILYVEDGNIVTSGGSAAGLDLLLHLVRSDFGAGISNEVARRLNFPAHRDGQQPQVIVRSVPPASNNRINQLIAWMREHIQEQLSVEMLASRAAMSPRNFYRHFRAATGLAPYEWLTCERVSVAAALLESTKHQLERIAEYSGFRSAEALRSHFTRIMGRSPSQYRRMSGQMLQRRNELESFSVDYRDAA